MVICSTCRLGPEFLFYDPRLSALTTCGSYMGLPAIYYRIRKLVQDATSSSGVSVGVAARGVYRMWKEGNRMSVPPDTVHATVRPISKLRPDSQGGSVLARWLPGLV